METPPLGGRELLPDPHAGLFRDRTDWPVGPRFRALTCPWLSLWSPSGFQNGFHVCVQQGGRRAAILLGFGPFPWLPRFGLSGSALRLCLPGFRVTVPCPLQGPHGVSCDVLAVTDIVPWRWQSGGSPSPTRLCWLTELSAREACRGAPQANGWPGL